MAYPTDELRNEDPVVFSSDFDLEKAVAEASDEDGTDGKFSISEDVIRDIARRAMGRVSAVQPAKSSAVLGIGRKSGDGIKVSLIEDGDMPVVSLDAYIQVRYGMRIPDVAWDLQEYLKNELEKSTGYEVKSVNIFVQGVYFDETPKTEKVTA